MLSNRFVERVRGDVAMLYKRLQYLDNLLAEWMQLQRQWLYLENIFSSADISAKLGSDAKRFA
jgi:dynein heavy chain